MDILGILKGFWESSGLAVLTWREGVMILVSFVLLYLAIAKKFEPLLLLPIAFGILLANLPGAGLMDDPTGIIDPLSTTIREGAHWYDIGILRLIYAGVKSSIFPCLIFMGVGAMTDFGPLIANPKTLLLGAAAQIGVFVALLGQGRGILIHTSGCSWSRRSNRTSFTGRRRAHIIYRCIFDINR